LKPKAAVNIHYRADEGRGKEKEYGKKGEAPKRRAAEIAQTHAEGVGNRLEKENPKGGEGQNIRRRVRTSSRNQSIKERGCSAVGGGAIL